ncbi:helicase associated domain-containing protein, partial [Streptomyces sp. NPDC095602]|uniref:helicase associated domain-containing protein n=1 Tax=Streptomyces sp. NPDC095602 TaxID=3155819 RepID=UPI00331C52F5
LPPAGQEEPGKGRKGAVGGFERGLAALEQYKARTGSVGPVSRSHVEVVVIEGEEHPVKLGVWLSNTKTRRAKLSTEQRAALAALGLGWAAA